MRAEFLFLGRQDVIAAGGLDMAAALTAVEEGFRRHGQGLFVQPAKVNVPVGPPDSLQATQGLVMAEPAYMGGPQPAIGLKWTLGMAENPTLRGIPRSTALVLFHDPETGWPLCIMDGTIVNQVGTGAVTGVGARYLARPESITLSIIGCGTQGRTQAIGVCAALPGIRRIILFDLDTGRAAALGTELQARLERPVTVAPSAEAAVRAADILVTITTSRQSYIERAWVNPGTFYADCASDDAKLAVYQGADKVVTDCWHDIMHHGKGVLVEAYRQGQFADSGIHADLGEIVTGARPGRETVQEFILFKHIGMAATAFPEAYRIYRNALSLGIGQMLTLFELPVQA